LAQIIDTLHPVGSLYFNDTSTNPAVLFGRGTWVAHGAGKVLISRDTGQNGGDLLGAATHSHAAHSDHAALTHSGAAVANHTFTQPTIGAEAAHTHTYTQTVNHVHVQSVNSASTGGLSGYTADTSTNTAVASGYSTQNPTGGVASGTTAAGASHTHTSTGGAVDAHGVTQPNQHAAQSHSAHDAVAHLPPAIVIYVWKRTA
jgi:hypothetical protein